MSEPVKSGSPKETTQATNKPYKANEEPKVKKDYETVFTALVKVLNDHDVDARMALHLAQDIITNATVALVVESSKSYNKGLKKA